MEPYRLKKEMDIRAREKLKTLISKYKWRKWPALPGRTNHIEAAVLLLISRDDAWTCTMTLRNSKLREHGGEICFPGGKPEERDKSLAQTAIRETEEELGVHAGEIIGRLSSVPLYTSDYRLEPFVAFIDHQKMSPCPQEVEAVLPISLKKALMMESIDGIPFRLEGWAGNEPGSIETLSPVFDTKELLENPVTETPIFGGTAFVFYELMTLVAKALAIPMPPLKKTARQFPPLNHSPKRESKGTSAGAHFKP